MQARKRAQTRTTDCFLVYASKSRLAFACCSSFISVKNCGSVNSVDTQNTHVLGCAYRTNRVYSPAQKTKMNTPVCVLMFVCFQRWHRVAACTGIWQVPGHLALLNSFCPLSKHARTHRAQKKDALKRGAPKLARHKRDHAEAKLWHTCENFLRVDPIIQGHLQLEESLP